MTTSIFAGECNEFAAIDSRGWGISADGCGQLVVLGVMGVYFVFVWRGATEESRRSLILAKASASSGDYVIINVKVTAIDVAQGLLHERIRLIPMGRFAVDRATPAVDLKLLINSVSGKQTVSVSQRRTNRTRRFHERSLGKSKPVSV